MGSVELLTCLWIGLMVFHSAYRPSKKNLLVMVPLFLFLVSMTISSLFGVNPLVSFFSTVEIGSGMIFLWHAFIFALMIVSLMRAQGVNFIKRILQAILFSGTVLAIMTFFTNRIFNIGSHMLNDSMGGATMGNSLLAGAYFIFVVFFGILLFVRDHSFVKRIIYGTSIGIILCSPILFLEGTIWRGELPFSDIFNHPQMILGLARMAGISLGIGLGISLFLWMILSHREGKKLKKIIGGIGLATVLLATAFGIYQVATPDTRLNTLFIQEANGRPIYWKVALEGFKEKPLLGWGQDNYETVYLKYLDPSVFSPKLSGEVWTARPHNASLEILVNGGLVGLVLYGFVILSLFGWMIILYRKDKMSASTGALLSGMIFAYVLQNQMVFDSAVSYVILFTVIALVAGYADSEGRHEIVAIDNRAEKRYALFGACLLMIPLWIFVTYLPARKAIEIKTVGDQASNIRGNSYHHLFTGGASYFFETDPQFFTLALADSYDVNRPYFKNNPEMAKIASVEIKSLLHEIDGIWDSQETNYKFALSALRLQNLMILLENDPSSQNIIRAKKYYDRAVSLSPTNPQSYLTYAETLGYSYTGDATGIKYLIDKALSLEPTYHAAISLKKDFDSVFNK